MLRRDAWPLALLAIVVMLIPLAAAPSVRAASTTVVISEFRTRGPSGGNDEFVELFNLSATVVDIGGWKINGSNASAGVSTRLTIASGTVLLPGQHYLAVNRTTNGGYSGSVPGDNPAGYTTGISDDGGLALLDAGNTVIDQIGLSIGSAYGEGTRLPAFGNENSDRSYRRVDQCVDTDDNLADFDAASPGTPENTAVSPAPCDATGPTPTPGEPTPTPTPAEPTPTPTPAEPTPTPVPLPLTPIREIQGASHVSPLAGTSVRTEGVVTAVRGNGFWIQDPAPDGDDATSEAIFVFTSSAPTVAQGDSLSVTGSAGEFRPGGSGGTNNLTLTQLTAPTISLLSSGNPLPAPTLIGPGGRVPPTTVIDDDANGSVETSGTFDPASDGIDFYESLEGMLLQLDDAVAVGPRSDFGEIPVLAANGAGAGVRTTRGGIVVRADDFNPERIFLDDVIVDLPELDVGDRLPGATIGVLDYSFGNFKLLVTKLPAVEDNGPAREVATAAGAEQLAVATFNVENLDPGDGAAKFTALAKAIVENLSSPDIVALEEVQDNNGPTNDAIVAADATYTTLTAAIRAVGGPQYSFRQVDPVDDQDGGEPGGNIRVGFLFRTDRGLSFVDRPGGDSTTSNEVVAGPTGPQLQFSPGRIDPTNPAFNSSRKPLAGEFEFNGNRVFVIANHFNSKGGDQPLFGRFQPPARVTEAQRRQQAQNVREFVDDIVALDPQANVIVLGDLNDFEFSDALQTLTAGGVLNNLIETLPQSERYTYVFEGNSQALDHILVSRNLFDNAAISYDIVHINAEFVDQISDHDPQVARIAFAAPPRLPVRPVLECVAANADGSYTARWGYRNENPYPALVPIGRENRFAPPPEARGQPTIFQPGRVRFAFETRFESRQTLVWQLRGRTATASRYGAACR